LKERELEEQCQLKERELEEQRQLKDRNLEEGRKEREEDRKSELWRRQYEKEQIHQKREDDDRPAEDVDKLLTRLGFPRSS